MLITNLTGERYEYSFDPKLIEKCLDDEGLYIHIPEMEMCLDDKCHWHILPSDGSPSKGNEIMPYYYNTAHIYSQFNIVKQVPIFLVTKEQCWKTFPVGYFGHVDKVTVPFDVLPDDLPSDISGISEDDERIYENIDPYRGERDVEKSIVSSIDLWGIYTREYPQGRPYGIEESHPRIFIWVDKIWEHVKRDERKCQVLVTQVILHELAHAMMDIDLAGSRGGGASNKFGKIFYTLKEESLATAMSLSLIKPHVSNEEWDFLVSVVKQQPFQYALGLDYLDDGRVVGRSVGEWMHLKECGSCSIQVVKHWIKYILGPRPLDCGQLELLDYGMWCPDDLYRYPATNGHFYDSFGVAVRVIADYIANHPSISRVDLHKAFPNDINDYYESIIDYPNQTEFPGKGRSSNTRSVDSDKIFACKDGKIAICDYWHPCSMEKFINNATSLNISIERFK